MTVSPHLRFCEFLINYAENRTRYQLFLATNFASLSVFTDRIVGHENVLDEVEAVEFTRQIETSLQNLLRQATAYPESDISMQQVAILLICWLSADAVPVDDIAYELGVKVKEIVPAIQTLVRRQQVRLRKGRGQGPSNCAILTPYGSSFVRQLWSAAQRNDTRGRTTSTKRSTSEASVPRRHAVSLASSMPGLHQPQMQSSVMDIHVGGRIRLRRKMLGLSQRTLASEAGVRLQHLQRFEYGVSAVDTDTLCMLAEKLDVPVSFFFDALSEELKKSSISTNGRLAMQDVEQIFVGSDTLRLQG